MIRFITMLLAFLPLGSIAQDTITLHKLKFSDIYPLYSKESRSAYAYLFSVADASMQPIGFQGANLEPYLKNHPGAYQTFLDFRVQTKRARTLNVIGTLSFAAGFAVLAVTASDDDVSDALKLTSGGVTLAGMTFNFIAGRTYRKARNTFEQSVEVYNRSR